MESVTASKLHGELFIGIETQGGVVKDYSLLRSNGVAEKVYTDKNGSKPYTWMASVIAVSLDRLGGISIGGAVRKEYVASGSLDIPHIVKQLTLADANTLLIEIHRRLWKNLIRNQDTLCKWCGNTMVMDIDLDRIALLPEDVHKLNTDWLTIPIALTNGWVFEAPTIVGSSQKKYEEYDKIEFNQFIFRCPTVEDGIRNEKYEADPIEFWRRIAFDCLISVNSVDAYGSIGTELPREAINIFGRKIFDEILDSSALIKIRETLREDPPSLPFYYLEECANANCRRETPVTMEANGFFSA